MDLYSAVVEVPPAPDFTITVHSVVAPGEVEVDGRPSRPGVDSRILTYDWDFGDGTTDSGDLVEHLYQKCGRFSISLTVMDDRGLSATTSRTVQIECPSTDLSAGWVSEDVGKPEFPGTAGFDATEDCLAISAAGETIGGTADEGHFVYRELRGDGTLAVRVSELNGNTGSKVGVMLRESLASGAPHATMFVEDGAFADVFQFSHRSDAESTTASKRGSRFTLPDAWIRIQRKGDQLIGCSSTDGMDWEEVGRTTFFLPADTLIGIVATGRDTDPHQPFTPLHASVCDLRLTPDVPPGPRFQRGDSNGDEDVNVADAVFTLGWLFAGGADPGCLAAADANGDWAVDVTDPVSLLNFLFAEAAPPPPPFPGAERDGPRTWR